MDSNYKIPKLPKIENDVGNFVQREHFSGAQKRRIHRLMNNGYSYDTAKQFVKDRLARINGSGPTTNIFSNKQNLHYITTIKKERTPLLPTPPPPPSPPKDCNADITKPFYQINSSQKSSNNDDDESADETFNNLSRRRISNLVESGMERKEAVELETEHRNIYKAYLACQQAEREELMLLQHLGDYRERIDDYFSVEDRSRVDKLVKHGIVPDIAEEMIKENLLIPKLEFKQETNDTKPNINPEFELSIVHYKHPIIKLNDYDIYILKSNLIEEIRKTQNADLDIMEFTPKNGWLALTCCNQQTKLWLYENITKLKLISNIQLKLLHGHEFPLSYIAKIILYPTNVLEPKIIMERLQQQNKKLQTDKWEVMEVKTLDNGVVVNYFSITPECCQILKKKRIQLKLHGRKIDVEIV